MAQKKKKVRWKIRPEIFIIMVIIACAITMLQFENRNRIQGTLVLDTNGGIYISRTIHEQPDDHSDEEVLWTYDISTCRFIEVCDVNLDCVFSIVYADIPMDPNPLLLYIDQMDLDIPLNEVGMTTIRTVDGDTADIYYVWTNRFDDGETYLLVQSVSHTARSRQRNTNMTCYMLIILSFILACIMFYWQCMGIVNQYRRIRRQMESDIYSLH